MKCKSKHCKLPFCKTIKRYFKHYEECTNRKSKKYCEHCYKLELFLRIVNNKPQNESDQNSQKNQMNISNK